MIETAWTHDVPKEPSMAPHVHYRALKALDFVQMDGKRTPLEVGEMLNVRLPIRESAAAELRRLFAGGFLEVLPPCCACASPRTGYVKVKMPAEASA